MSWVLFFDGDCGLCSESVRWVARSDKRARISFAPLQGELAKERGLAHHAAEKGGTMVVLRESDGRIFLRSDAWIELANALGGGWRVFTVARLIAKPLRDLLYNVVARNRYLFMGRAGTCALPDPELTGRLRN